MTTRILQTIVGIAGLCALTLGFFYWIAHSNVISFHKLFGFTVALGLLVMSIIALTTRGLRIWGSVGIVYALIIPIFGMTQSTLLIGDLHWLVRILHMLVGIGAIVLTGLMGNRYMELKRGRVVKPAIESEDLR